MAEWKPPALRIRVHWNEERANAVRERVFGSTEVRRAGAGRRMLPVLALAGVACLALGVIITHSTRTMPTASSPAPAIASSRATVPAVAAVPARVEAMREVRFHDGSVAVLEGGASDLRVQVADDRSIVSTLTEGKASFDVVPRPSRLFIVHAGAAVIEVLGTAFSVERLERSSSRVEVTRGRVRVSWSEGMRELVAGESAVLPPPVAPIPPARSPSPPLWPAPRVARTPPSSRAAAPDSPPEQPAAVTPPALAARVEPPSQRASRLPAARRSDPVDDLFRAADAARLDGRPDDAVVALRAILGDHPGEGRAPLAAFLLGRILVDDLRRPAEAAGMFARARALSPDGPLIEDAFLREADAWIRAGAPERARACAADYLRRFGTSPRAARMRRLTEQP